MQVISKTTMPGTAASGASSPDVSKKTITLDDVLINEVGQFGWFQARNVLLVSLPIIFSAFKTDYIFTAAAIPHRCRIPECGDIGKLSEYNPSWILNAVPAKGSGFASCERYVPLDVGVNDSLGYCPESLFNQSKRAPCDGYVYAGDNSVVYDFDLGCEDWLRALAGTLTSLGMLLGLPVTGYVSDRFGRKFALIFNVSSLGLVGFLRIFSVNYTMFMILQVLQTFFGGGIYSASFVIAAELVGPKYRVLITAVTTSMFSLGQVVLGIAAWQLQTWRQIITVLYIPSILIISYYWIVSESVRWLLSKGKYTRAKILLEKLANVNGKKINDKSMDALTNPPPSVAKVKQNKSGLIPRIIRSPILLRRVCTTPTWWITATLTYYGLSINSTSLSDTVYLNYILVSAIEIPGFFSVILFLDRFGRKATLSGSFLLCAACNITFVLIPKNLETLRLIIYLIGKLCSSVVMGSLYLYTSELYPTEFRHSLLAFSSMVGRVGSILAPLTPVLTKYWHGIPSMLFGVMGIVSGVLVLTQPETLGTKIPETLADAEALGKPEGTTRKQ